MATQSLLPASKAKRNELDSILTVWENRYKLRVLSMMLPRAIIVGLLISIGIGLFGYSQRLLPAQTFAVMTLSICGLSGLGVVLYTQFFPRQRQAAAQYFDIEFHLHERVSTAFELLDGRIQTHPDIEAMQIADTLRYAHEIDPQADIQMDFRQREILFLGILGVVALAMLLVSLIFGQTLSAEDPSAAVLAAQEEVLDITETIATDTDINDIDREELLNALEIALERLEEQDITDEEAFAAMSQLESKIDEIQQELQDTLELDQSALEAATESLSALTSPTESEENNPTEDGDLPPENALPSAEELSQALDELDQTAPSMTPEEAQAMADALRQAAQEVMESNPELAQALEDAADALENGDNQTLQEQLDQAQQQLQQQQQQAQQNQDSQQMLQDQSERAQQMAEQISQQQQSEQSQQSGESEQQSQQSQQGQEQQESDNQQAGETNSSQQGEGEPESAQQGDAQGGNQQANSNQPAENESEAQSESSDTSGQGAGEGEASNTAMSGGGGEDQGAETDNETTGEGEIEYEAIYNPTGINGGGANEIQLESDASDQPFSEGDFDDNPFGESQVSYDTVFNDYQDAANRALESDYVPLGLRDVVREYFTSLEPNRGE